MQISVAMPTAHAANAAVVDTLIDPVSDASVDTYSERAASANTGASRLVFRPRGEFLATLRARVDAHFGDRPRSDDPRLHRKAAFIVAWFLASYVLLLTVQIGWLQLLLCLSYALAASALGFNVFHDANHGSFSSNKRLNLLVSQLTCMMLGPSRYLWRHKHHVLHHVYTNVFQWDDDIETRGHLRMSPRQPWEAKYKNQHLFFFFLYSFSTMEWFFTKNFIQYFTLRINPYVAIPALSRREKVEFWLSAAFYFTFFVALPFALLPVWKVLVGLVIFHVLFGMVLTLIFQIAHGTEKVDFPVPTGNQPASIDDEWAAHELRTTVNFGTSNRLLNWYAGGLNFQIEHHLFPYISHTHYPAMSVIVRQTAREFGLPYHEHETYLGAVLSHYRFMRALGVAPQAA